MKDGITKSYYPEYESIASGSIIPGLLTCSKSLKPSLYHGGVRDQGSVVKAQAAFPNGPQSGPSGAHLGPNFAQLGPNRGPHGMLLGRASLSASRDPDSGGGGGGDFHFQHGFYEMWVTKALNGDREQAQLFLAFGRGLAQAGIPARSPIASRSHRALYGAVPGACTGGRLVGGAYAPCRPYRRPHVRLISLFPRLIQL